MKSNINSTNVGIKMILILALILLSVRCSGSKEFDSRPEPIGGDMKVKSVFQVALGNAYHQLSGSRVGFDIKIDRYGNVKDANVIYGKYSYYNQILEKAIRRIKFRPATKDGKRVEAKFSYHFLF